MFCAAIDEVLIRSATPLLGRRLDQLRDERADRVHQPADVDVDLTLPLIGGQLLDRSGQHDARVVEQQVQHRRIRPPPGSAAERTASASVTSTARASAVPPFFSMSGDQLLQPVGTPGEDGDFRASAASRFAVASPMPLEAPVTTATRPASGAAVSIEVVILHSPDVSVAAVLPRTRHNNQERRLEPANCAPVNLGPPDLRLFGCGGRPAVKLEVWTTTLSSGSSCARDVLD